MGRFAPAEGELVLIFRGTHQVLTAEKALKNGGVGMRLIPVPRRLSSDCGLAIRIPPADIPRAREVLRAAGLPPRSAHILQNGEYGDFAF